MTISQLLTSGGTTPQSTQKLCNLSNSYTLLLSPTNFTARFSPIQGINNDTSTKRRLSTHCGEAQTWAEHSIALSTQHLYAAACHDILIILSALNLTPFPTSQRLPLLLTLPIPSQQLLLRIYYLCGCCQASTSYKRLRRTPHLIFPLLLNPAWHPQASKTKHTTCRPISYQVLVIASCSVTMLHQFLNSINADAGTGHDVTLK